MEDRHGDVTHRFPGLGPLPVRAFVLWKRALHALEPKTTVLACQELVERFPDVMLGPRRAREAALRLQLDTLAKRGRGAYDAIEKRALPRTSSYCARCPLVGSTLVWKPIGWKYGSRS